jgi:hypothetical protein
MAPSDSGLRDSKRLYICPWNRLSADRNIDLVITQSYRKDSGSSLADLLLLNTHRGSHSSGYSVIISYMACRTRVLISLDD